IPSVGVPAHPDSGPGYVRGYVRAPVASSGAARTSSSRDLANEAPALPRRRGLSEPARGPEPLHCAIDPERQLPRRLGEREQARWSLAVVVETDEHQHEREDQDG